MIRIIHNLSLNKPSQCERLSKENMTVPDQSLSIQELIYRFTRGVPLEGARPVYYDEEFGESLRPELIKDLTDLDNVAIELQATKARIDKNNKVSKKKTETQDEDPKGSSEAESSGVERSE